MSLFPPVKAGTLLLLRLWRNPAGLDGTAHSEGCQKQKVLCQVVVDPPT